ncbi:MAG: DUF4430 domain-containing protein [Clostridiales bacterium]|jgi:hypothetical protein|nr:DUF4430 domain-containing protein [Clostridiales bacterium]
MKKRGKITTALLLLLLLTAAWFAGGGAKNPDKQAQAQVQYPAEPAPEGAPPANPREGGPGHSCTLSVECSSILYNIESLDPEKAELVPEDGVIFPPTEVAFYEGESVFDALRRELRRNKIHLEFVDAPFYDSAYIEGIGNIYEFDCGELSGWLYRVNGSFQDYGCSRRKLEDGDRVEFVYTCDLGRDVGADEEGALRSR